MVVVRVDHVAGGGGGGVHRRLILQVVHGRRGKAREASQWLSLSVRVGDCDCSAATHDGGRRREVGHVGRQVQRAGRALLSDGVPREAAHRVAAAAGVAAVRQQRRLTAVRAASAVPSVRTARQRAETLGGEAGVVGGVLAVVRLWRQWRGVDV